MSQLDLIRESLNTVLAELRRDVAYADLQNSYGRVFVTIGMDLLPQDYQTLNVEALGQEIGQRFDQWQHSAQSAQSAEAVVPVESDQVVASDKTS